MQLLIQLLKTEILNNKNIEYKLNIYANKIKNLDRFYKFLLKLK